MKFANYKSIQHQHLSCHTVLLKKKKNFYFLFVLWTAAPYQFLYHIIIRLQQSSKHKNDLIINFPFTTQQIDVYQIQCYNMYILSIHKLYCFWIVLIIICFVFVSSRCYYIRFRSGSTRSYVGCTTEQCNRCFFVDWL